MRSRSEQIGLEKPSTTPVLRPNRRVPALLIVGTLVVGSIIIFLISLSGGPTDLGPPEFRATLKDATSTTEALAFLGQAAAGTGRVEQVELNDEDRRLVVRFNKVGPKTVACSIYRAAADVDIFEDIEVTFSPVSCIP